MNHNDRVGKLDKTRLKQIALAYLPRNLGEVEAQRQILSMIAQAAPAVAPCMEQADIMIWPKVRSKEITINQALAWCSHETDLAIGSMISGEQALKSLSEADLLQAWISLDYYAYVQKAEYSVNIRNFQQQITDLLTAPQVQQAQIEPTMPVYAEQIEPTVPIYAEQIEPTIPICAEPIEPTAPIYAEQPVQIEPTMPIYVEEPEADPTPSVSATAPVEPSWTQDTTGTQKGKTSGKKATKFVPVLAILVVLILAAAFMATQLFSDTRKAEAAINNIGTVTLDSEEQIVQAENLYNALTEDQQSQVDNRDTLFAARAEYDCLITEEAIDRIGTVTMESKDLILEAEKLYDSLSRDARNLLDNYKVLTAARKEYDRLEGAIKKASDAIDAIGSVTLQSADAIESARSAYEALKKDGLQKYVSGKAATLTAAEQRYRQLVSQDLYDTGLAHQKAGRYAEAIACYDSIIADYSDTSLPKEAAGSRADCQIALADQAYGKRDYYTAMQTLNSMDNAYKYQDNYKTLYDKIVTALTRARPGNTTTIDGNLQWGRCYFQITAGDQDVCYKFQKKDDPSKYKIVYIRAGQKAKINVEDGTYTIKWATGDYWFGKDHFFGDETKYFTRGDVDFTTTYEGNRVYFWYLELDMSSSTFFADPIDAKNF